MAITDSILYCTEAHDHDPIVTSRGDRMLPSQAARQHERARTRSRLGGCTGPALRPAATFARTDRIQRARRYELRR